jgi:hypothetical protein
MLTIENYKNLENKTFWTKSDTQEWIVSRIEETLNDYKIAVMPLDSEFQMYVISKAIIYTLKRNKKNRRGYEMINSKNDRVALVTESNLTFDNFILELLIQTALNTNQC